MRQRQKVENTLHTAFLNDFSGKNTTPSIERKCRTQTEVLLQLKLQLLKSKNKFQVQMMCFNSRKKKERGEKGENN